MSRMIFVNLPVADLPRSVEFFAALGFGTDPRFTNADAACVVIEENSVYAMLLTRPFFQGFINDAIADTTKEREVLVCLSAASRAEVDDLYDRAVAAGAKPWRPRVDEGPMYGASFQDPDGHVWELMHMAL